MTAGALATLRRRAATLALCVAALTVLPAGAPAAMGGVSVPMTVLAEQHVSNDCADSVALGTVARGSSATGSCTVQFGSTNALGGTLLQVSDSGGAGPVMRSGADSIPDYAAAGVNWASTASSVFGACLRAVTNGVGHKTVAPGANCATTDVVPWFGITDSAATVAASSTPGVDATAALVFGSRISPTQPSGAYSGNVTLTVVAIP